MHLVSHFNKVTQCSGTSGKNTIRPKFIAFIIENDNKIYIVLNHIGHKKSDTIDQSISDVITDFHTGYVTNHITVHVRKSTARFSIRRP